MKIGIFLAYGPQTHLGQEGLGRYLAGLVKGFTEQGQDIIVVTPKWSLETITELFREFGIQDESVSFAALEKVPVFWGGLEFIRRFRRHKQKKAKQYRILRTGMDLLEKFIGCLIGITNMILFGILSAIAALLACILLPVAVVLGLIYSLFHLLKCVIRKGRFTLKDVYRKIMRVTQILSQKGISLDEYAYRKLMDQTTELLIEKANRQNVDVWFVPTVFWPETKNLKQVRVITVPDLVTEEFANLCADDPQYAYSIKKCRETVETGEYFITYCSYVKKSVLNYRYGKNMVKVIPHPVNSMLPYIAIDPKIEEKLNSSNNFTDAFARIQLRLVQSNVKYWPETLVRYSFQNMKYIFFASQARPYKNILTLVRAYYELTRKRYCNIKLVLTCDLKMCPDAYDFIEENGLQFDVLSFFGVSAQQLASLYRCAELVVNPTLYEGGFPFTFGEGMSVGTPSLMSDIPQVRDVVEEYGLAEDMLFDPYDYIALADKIEDGLRNREMLYQKQLPLYKDMEARTTSVVAAEYLAAFESFIGQEKEKRHA